MYNLILKKASTNTSTDDAVSAHSLQSDKASGASHGPKQQWLGTSMSGEVMMQGHGRSRFAIGTARRGFKAKGLLPPKETS